MNKGILMVLSGPSGCGKGTLTNEIIKEKNVGISVSATTRSKRPGEIDGKDYHFISKEDFKAKLEKGEFLEYNCYCGNYYGTLKKEVENLLDLGKDVILEIDVCGAKQVYEKMKSVSVFVLPPSMQDLKQRLIKRGSEADVEIENRYNIAKNEVKQAKMYDYIVINDSVDRAVDKLKKILSAQKNKTQNMLYKLKEVIENESK